MVLRASAQAQTRRRGAGRRPSGRGPLRASCNKLALLFLAALMLGATLPTGHESFALTSATITIDGDMSDWEGVFLDPDNVVFDTIIPEDPDEPGQGDRDLDVVATTWDSENLYLFWRRTAAGSRAITMFAYIDRDGTGVMNDGDMVVIMTFGNSGYQSNPNSSNVVYYEPADPAGDAMLGDGHTMPGFARANRSRVPGAVYAGEKDSSGLRFEGSVSWTSLGLQPGSPVAIQFAAANGTESPGHIQDNAGPGGGLSLAHPDVALTPSASSSGGAAGSTVVYSYTVTNTGNVPQSYSVAAESSAGWGTELLHDGAPVDALSLAPGDSATIEVLVSIPAGAAQGAVDTTTLHVASVTDPDVAAAATARTTVGAITVTPDRSASISAGGTVTYEHTVANNTGAAADLELDASSSAGWSTEVLAEDGVTPISTLSLGPGESATVLLSVTAPAGATNGSQDVTSLRARLIDEPTVSASARDTTTVRSELTISPDRQSVGGPGTAVSYVHRVTNNSSETRTITLSASSSLGWVTGIYAADGVTPISSVTLGPNGDASDIIVRVHIPEGATNAQTDTTTVTAAHGAVTSSVTDTTGVRTLATYDGPGFATVSTSFTPGDTVYARGMGLSDYSEVRFRWIDSTGAVVYVSPSVPVDALDMAFNSYPLPAEAALGEWTLVLVNASNNAEITRSHFDVLPDATITALSASDAPGLGQTVEISSSVSNSGSAPIAGSTMTYVIWWDTDGDGVFGAGDLYIDASGASHVWDGVSPVHTHVTAGIDVSGGGSWTEPTPWTISNTGFPNQGTYRVSATWTTSDGIPIDTRTTEFYSIPALGWPLLLLTVFGGGTLLWRRRALITTTAEEARP